MSVPIDLPLGERIELLRRRRGMSRQVLASLVGYSSEWLRQVERNERPVDRLSVLLRIAGVLQVNDIADFLGLHVEDGRAPDSGQVVSAPVREALHHSWVGADGDAAERDGLADRVRHRLDETVVAWRDSPRRYSRVLRELPALIEPVGQLARADSPAGQVLFADVHRLAAVMLLQVGDHPLALMAIDRSMFAARLSRNTDTRAGCAVTLGSVLLRGGFPEKAREICLAAAAGVEHTIAQDRLGLALWGSLHLTAAEAAAAASDHNLAMRLLDSARQAAEELPDKPSEAVDGFGRAEVDVRLIEIEVRLGRIRQALRQAARTEVTGRLSAGRLAQYRVTLTQAHVRNGDPVAAAFTLLQAEEACPEEIRFNPDARAALTEILRRDDATVRHEVWGLARRTRLL
ncbi:helix-turn-helix domain-containing protein [Streptomyces gilvosporeus]|uniref:HTH cro/C1-type domain-containing protein n=1 Tax=Streptomyces gilvosporeus TaxID=553510 RepID=A0A1V0TK17_9ACTN|nr:helix-turn-helix domain-containing protein [Streptomyces gilvosporeus]ARF53148.1 hypothetical protein B1H19_02210 [Streptomyces gilvosporeus]